MWRLKIFIVAFVASICSAIAPCPVPNPLVLSGLSGNITVGDVSRRSFLDPSDHVCLWVIEPLDPSATVSVTVNWVYLGLGPGCHDGDASLDIFLGNAGQPSASWCWLDNEPMPLSSMSGSQTAINSQTSTPTATATPSVTPSASSTGKFMKDYNAAGDTSKQGPAGGRALEVSTRKMQSSGGTTFSSTGSITLMLDVSAAHTAFGFSATYVVGAMPLTSATMTATMSLTPTAAAVNSTSSSTGTRSGTGTRTPAPAAASASSTASITASPTRSFVISPGAGNLSAIVIMRTTPTWSPGSWRNANPTYPDASPARAELAAALGAAAYRFDGFEWTGPSAYTLTFQIVPPVTAGESSSAAIAAALSAAMASESSALRRGTIFRGAASAFVSLSQPAGITISPSPLIVTMPFRADVRPPQGVVGELYIRNTGAAPLIISAVEVAAIDATSLPLSAVRIAPGQIPATVQVGTPLVLRVNFDGAALVVGARAPATYLLSLTHNVPGGAHAVGVEVSIVGIPSSSPGPGAPVDTSVGAILSSGAFKAGIATAYGALVVVLIIALIIYWRCCKRRRADSDSDKHESAAAAAAPSGRHGPRRELTCYDILFGPVPPRRGAVRPGAGGGRRPGTPPPGPVVAADDDSSEGGSRAQHDGDGAGTSADRGSDAPAQTSEGGSVKVTAARGILKGAAAQRSGGFGALRDDADDDDDDEEEWGDIGRGAAASKVKVPLRPAAAPRAGVSIEMTSPSALRSADAAAGSSRRGRLRPRPVALRADEFESRWASLPAVEVWGCALDARPPPLGLEGALSTAGIACMASGDGAGGALKAFFYGQEEGADGGLAIAEVTVAPRPSCRLSAVVKGADARVGALFLDAFKAAVGAYNDKVLRSLTATSTAAQSAAAPVAAAAAPRVRGGSPDAGPEDGAADAGPHV